jgi:hypothetical protein
MLSVTGNDHLKADEAMSLDEYCGYHLDLSYHDVESAPAGEHSQRRLLPHPLQSQSLLSCDENSSRFPWRLLLAGGDDPPRLSLVKAEQECLGLPGVTGLKIQRSCDVDSFLARITTLAAHRGGFNLAYYPPFLRRITQNQYIKIHGYKVHKMKNLRLGTGAFSQGLNYDCHVVFPHMPVPSKAETHLTDIQQAFWIDRIIVRALRHTCPNHIIQHHPRSFGDAKAKAVVKQEAFFQGSKQAMDPRYLIPEEFLSIFWEEVLRLVEAAVVAEPERGGEFRDLFLVVSGHDLKLIHGSSSGERTRSRFLHYLDTCFDFQPDIFPEDDCWLDFGWEDTPVDSDVPVTLVRKASCLRYWTDRFQSPTGLSAKINPQFFRWFLTRDAGSARVALGTTNVLHQEGGMAYHKAYSLHKDVFATPLKGHNPFGPVWLEGLAFSQENLDRWADANNPGSSGQNKQKRQALIHAAVATKTRLFAALTSSINTDFGVRQEYRINIRLFHALDLSDEVFVDDIDGDGEVESHRPYWILSTTAVTRFVWVEIKRWLLGIEFLASRAEGKTRQINNVVTGSGQQLIDAAMMVALLRSLRFSLAGDDPSKKHELWRDSYPGQRQIRDETRPRGFRWADSGVTMRGLNYQHSLNTYGVAWFPDDLVHWESLTFKPEIYKVVSFRRNGTAESFRNAAQAQRMIEKDELMIAHLKARLEALPTEQMTAGWNDGDQLKDGLRLASQLVIQAYILDVCQQLRERCRGDAASLQRIELLTQEGLQGLSYTLVAKMLDHSPHIIFPREVGVHGRARNGVAQFKGSSEGLWVDKLQGLFEWGDEAMEGRGGKRRGWHHKRFRLLARRLYTVVMEVRGREVAEKFQGGLGGEAARHVWIIPQYDKDHFSVLRKKSKHHAAETREYIDSISELERTNWIMAGFKKESSEALALARLGDQEESRVRLEGGQVEKYRGRVQRGLRLGRLVVFKQEGEESMFRRVLVTGQGIGWSLRLSSASDFLEEIKGEGEGEGGEENSIDEGD